MSDTLIAVVKKCGEMFREYEEIASKSCHHREPEYQELALMCENALEIEKRRKASSDKI